MAGTIATIPVPKAKKGKGKPKSKEKPSLVEQLLSMAEGVEVFNTLDRCGYAVVPVGEGTDAHLETHPVHGRGFRDWLQHQHYRKTKGAVSASVMTDALNTVESWALFDGKTENVYVRVGHADNRTYLDLGDPMWRAVEVDSKGWRVLSKSPVRFQRTGGMLPLPMPERGGHLDELKQFLNLDWTGDDWLLLLGWMVACLYHAGPYPVLILVAEQGSGKSTFCRVLRQLLDPSMAAVRAAPRDQHDLFIAAENSRLIVLDNLSGIPPGWLTPSAD